MPVNKIQPTEGAPNPTQCSKWSMGESWIDLFHHKSHDYLLVADYSSDVPLVREHSSQMASPVMSLLKTIFQSITFQPMCSETKDSSLHQLYFKNLQDDTNRRFFAQHPYFHSSMGVLK